MIKVDVVSGFLGAGKTTFIKKLVEEAFKGEKIVLIENEFGEVGIDGGFLKDAGIEITEMNSGCICCTLVGDFDRNLKDVVDRFSPDRIIIEPSGVGKLSDVAASIQNVAQEKPLEINALVAVVNAVKAKRMMKNFGEFFNNQIEFANTVVLSRTQEMAPEKVEEAAALIREKNPDAAILTTPWDDLTVDQIKKVYESKQSMLSDLLEEAQKAAEEHAREHDHEHEDGECCCHHDHDEEEHEHHHHHDHDDAEHEHHHHHDHDEEELEHHHHHDHDDGAHHHEHAHHHHHADEVFQNFGIETPHQFDRAVLENALKTLADDDTYDYILRAKGIVPCTDGRWAYFDMVPGAYEIRDGEPDYTGRLVVIGTKIDEEALRKLFGME